MNSLKQKAFIIGKTLEKYNYLKSQGSFDPDFTMLHDDLIKAISDIEIESLNDLIIQIQDIPEEQCRLEEFKKRKKEFEYLHDDSMMLIGISNNSQLIFNFILVEILLFNNFNQEFIEKASDLLCNLYNKNVERNNFKSNDEVDKIINFLVFFGIQDEEMIDLIEMVN